MFNPRDLMSPYYKDLSSQVKDDFKLENETKGQKLILMNWADPFRPDDTIPAHIKKATIDCINTTGAHYTFPTGDIELRTEIAKRLKKVNGLDVNPQKNVTISSGSDAAFLYTMRPFLEPGDEVMSPSPSYVHNFCVPPLCGAKTIAVPTWPEDGFDLRIEEFEKRLTSKTKMIVFTNPNNPTSTVYKRSTLEKLSEFAIKNNLIVIVDQCFEDTVFDGHEMVNIMGLPDMFERTIMINSFSKNMGLCGYRVAYIVASDEISDMLHYISVFVIGAPNTAAQAGIIAGLKNPDFIEEYRQEYMIRARLISPILDEIPHISYVMPESGFFFWINVSYYGSQIEVLRYIAREASVLLSNGSLSNDSEHIRLIYGALSSRDECIKAVESIRDALLMHPKAKQ